MVSNTATVRALSTKGENVWIELPIDQLVPGDIIRSWRRGYDPGGFARHVGRDLFVAQASLTGESCPWRRWRGPAIRSR